MSIWRVGGNLPRISGGPVRSGIGLRGMVHRMAARTDRCRRPADEFPAPEPLRNHRFQRVVPLAKRLFTWLRNGRAEFWWDYDDYYVGNADHEAGLFLRSISGISCRWIPEPHSRFITRRKGLSSFGPVGQPAVQVCAYVSRRIVCDAVLKPDKETAIRTDRRACCSVLYSGPDEIGAVNVTMGYPLRQTTAYSLSGGCWCNAASAGRKDSTLEFYPQQRCRGHS